MVVRNGGEEVSDIGVYLAFLPPDGFSNLGNCAPAGVLNWVEVVTEGAETFLDDVPSRDGGRRVSLKAEVDWSCSDPSVVDGGHYTLKAIADLHADDFDSCDSLTELFNGVCDSAINDDDDDDSDNARTRPLPLIKFLP